MDSITMPQKKLDTNTFLELLSVKPKVLFIFDYDGTLTHLVKDHNGAILTDDEVALINELSQQDDTKVAIVTGRALANLKTLLGGRLDPSIMLYGSHGAEKGEEHRESNYKEHLEKIYSVFKDEPHIHFEHKPLSITIHYKEHPDRDELIGRLNSEAEKHSELFRIQTGHDVYEFLPKDINKGMAIVDLNNNYSDHYLVFLGDDLTDNYGFREINKLGGLSIQVSDRMKEREAGYLIDRVEDTYALIRSYLKA